MPHLEGIRPRFDLLSESAMEVFLLSETQCHFLSCRCEINGGTKKYPLMSGSFGYGKHIKIDDFWRQGMSLWFCMAVRFP